MRVLLIQPQSCDPLMDQVYLFEPLALEYLGAGLKLDGHEVTLLDARIDTDVDGAIRRFAPDLVGLTGFTSHVNIVKNIARRIKEQAPDTRVAVGGHHATVRPETFNEPCFDVVVIGEGVFALREIATALESARPLSGIEGVAVPHPGGMIFSERRPYTPLDELPLPDRSLTAQYRKHYFSEWFKPLASIRTSLGCTARCNFCALWSITEGKYLRRDPVSVVQELQTISEPNVFFCDDESMCDVKRMDLLADLIRKAGIRKKYFLYSRVDTIVNHRELFAKWAEIGLVQVFVGMEDFSDRRLKAMNKGVSTAQQQQAVKILGDLGIMMYASYMVDPAYSKEDFRGLLAYVRELKHNYATFTVMTPLPGTKLHADREKELLSAKPELYDMIHALLPTALPLPEFYKEMANLWVNAVPFYRVFPALLRFGLHGMLLRMRLLGAFLEKVRAAHLDYV